MNGLDFDHRVLKPWANNPAFYVTVFPSRAISRRARAHAALGAIELWTYAFPLTSDKARGDGCRYARDSRLLEQAKKNLTGTGRGPLDVRHQEHQGAERGSGASRQARGGIARDARS